MSITPFLLQYLGIFSLVSIVIIGFFMVRKDPDSDHTSISSYAGSEKSQSQLAFLALVVLSIPFYLWAVFWLIPQYQLSSILFLFLAVSFFCHLLLIRFPLIPSNGRKHTSNLLHLAAGSVIAFSMFGLLIALSFSNLIDDLNLARLLLFVTEWYMFLCLVAYLFVRNKKYFFEFEVIYILLFALCVGFVSVQV